MSKLNEQTSVYMELADGRGGTFAHVGYTTYRGYRLVEALSLRHEERTFTGHDADDQARSWLAEQAERTRPDQKYLRN